MHTKGPWDWIIHDYSMATLHGPDEMFDHVLSISPCDSCLKHAKTRGEAGWKWNRCTTPTPANARLIAAAPELLEQLEHARETISKAYDEIKHISGDWIEPLRVELIVARKMSDDAIRKAKSQHGTLKGE